MNYLLALTLLLLTVFADTTAPTACPAGIWNQTSEQLTFQDSMSSTLKTALNNALCSRMINNVLYTVGTSGSSLESESFTPPITSNTVITAITNLPTKCVINANGTAFLLNEAGQTATYNVLTPNTAAVAGPTLTPVDGDFNIKSLHTASATSDVAAVSGTKGHLYSYNAADSTWTTMTAPSTFIPTTGYSTYMGLWESTLAGVLVNLTQNLPTGRIARQGYAPVSGFAAPDASAWKQQETADESKNNINFLPGYAVGSTGAIGYMGPFEGTSAGALGSLAWLKSDLSKWSTRNCEFLAAPDTALGANTTLTGTGVVRNAVTSTTNTIGDPNGSTIVTQTVSSLAQTVPERAGGQRLLSSVVLGVASAMVLL